MSKLICDITMSLDGFVAGPDPSLEDPLGKGGMQLHEWAFRLATWRRQHGLEGGEETPDGDVVEETLAGVGAYVMGRKMFSGGSGPWEGDSNSKGWWGDDPPYHTPVFVLTSHPREPLELQGGTTFVFVSDGIGPALEQARAAAGGRNVMLAGGAAVVQQYLNAGLLDELQIHVAPLLLGSGTRLLDGVGSDVRFEQERVLSSPHVTHLRYRISKGATS